MRVSDELVPFLNVIYTQVELVTRLSSLVKK